MVPLRMTDRRTVNVGFGAPTVGGAYSSGTSAMTINVEGLTVKGSIAEDTYTTRPSLFRLWTFGASTGNGWSLTQLVLVMTGKPICSLQRKSRASCTFFTPGNLLQFLGSNATCDATLRLAWYSSGRASALPDLSSRVALTVCVSGLLPSSQVQDAMPSAPVWTSTLEPLPPAPSCCKPPVPFVTAKCTVAPTTGMLPFVTPARSGSANGTRAGAGAVRSGMTSWPSPPT